MAKKVAVILSGCGYLDGAEIRESVLSLLALDQAGAVVTMYAPDEQAHHEVDHLKGEEVGDGRNILNESARIARGKVEDIAHLKVDDFDALVMPGGFGVAKNLCTFAFKGSACEVHPKVEKIVENFHQSKKPIGAICIAPALIAKVLGQHKVEVTIGNDAETATEVEKTGAKHVNKEVHEIHVDHANKIVTTPAYMFDGAPLSKINEGISQCVQKVIELT